MKEKEIVKIFSGNAIQADLVQQFLLENGIMSVINNNLMEGILFGPGGNPVNLFVDTNDAQRARDILAESKDIIDGF